MAFRSFAVLSLLVAAALAQSNPYVPSGISTGCANYLNTLNSDSSFAGCTQSLTSALSQFAPGSNTASLSSSTITSTLQSLCKSNPPISCPQNTVTAQLSSFYANCQTELTSSPNQLVKTTYDAVYALIPLSEAICSKDDNGNFCAAKLSNSTASTGAGSIPIADSPQALLNQYLYTTANAPTRRDGNSSTTPALLPNTTTFQNMNLVFLFLDPSAPVGELCQTCTRSILTPYINFESTITYGPGINQSLLFSGQSDLYGNITVRCPAGFLSGAVQAAGGLSGGIMSAASRVDAQDLSAAVSAIFGLAALVAAAI